MKKKILVVLAGGGHTAETAMLVELLGRKYQYSYVVGQGDKLSSGKRPFPGPAYVVPMPGVWGENPFRFLIKSAHSLFSSLAIILRDQPDAVLSVGKDITVPVSFAAKLLGKKVIYSESMQKVFAKSIGGKIIEHYADLFFVQWEDSLEHYPDAVYAGRLS